MSEEDEPRSDRCAAQLSVAGALDELRALAIDIKDRRVSDAIYACADGIEREIAAYDGELLRRLIRPKAEVQ